MKKKQKNLPKIKQNLDVKQKAIVGIRKLKEYLYNKRANLTYEEVDKMIQAVSETIYEMSYSNGWKDAMEIHSVRKHNHHAVLIKAFNDFYNKHIGKIAINTMEEVRYILDIATNERYMDVNFPLDQQVNNKTI
jgi:Ca2+-binding EF-hand superfamily protein